MYNYILNYNKTINIKPIFLLGIVFIFSFSLKSQTLQILPIGNSITQLNNQRYSYRYELWKKLIDSEIDFNYVGSITDHYDCGTPVFPDYNGQSFDKDHEGHWGWRCDEIINGGISFNCRGTGNLISWLNNYTPDIALIHLGTNDMIQQWNGGLGVAETIIELKTIISLLRVDNPNVIILLAQVIPADPSQFYWASYLDSLNTEIPSIATDLYDANSPIVIVDHNTGFDPVNDTFDGVHPNTVGEEKMAQKWHDAILSVLSGGNGFGLNIKTYLEGPYNGYEMNTIIQDSIPLQQPFNKPPWNYSGIESVTSLPSLDIVDWVLVELRDTTVASLATEQTRLSRKAGFLLNNGSVVDLDGTSNLSFSESISNQLFVIIHHKNHLPVLSLNALTETSGIYSYDFSTAANKAYGNTQTDLGDGNFAMIAGDINSDGVINASDISTDWTLQAGLKGYYQADVNLNSHVDNSDKNLFWYNNKGLSSNLP